MQSSYIARLSDNRLISVYHFNNNLCYRICENGRWLLQNIFLEEAQPNFTLNFSNKNQLRIFSADKSGSINLVTFNGKEAYRQTILENKSNEVHTILFHSLEAGNTMGLIYNIPTEGGKQKLIFQTFNENGKWGSPEEIAVFLPFSGGLFEFQRITNSHGLVFYRQESGLAGYKEVTAAKVSEFIPIQKHVENMQSYSFHTNIHGLHTLYIASNLFSSRLIYRRKVSDSFEAPIIIWEAPGLENCLICEIKGTIYAFFQAINKLFVAKSLDKGASFSRPEQYQHKFCLRPEKSVYISAVANEDFSMNNVFTDSQCPWDIQIFPEKCENFYIYTETKKEPEPEEIPPETPPQKAAPLPSGDSATRLEMITKRMERLSAENMELRSKITDLTTTLAENKSQRLEAQTVATSELADKDRQIKALKERNQKLESDSKKHKATATKHSRQVRRLEKEISLLKSGGDSEEESAGED